MNEQEFSMGDLEEITRQIQEGFTLGRLDNEEGQHIYWELKYDVWKDDD